MLFMRIRTAQVFRCLVISSILFSGVLPFFNLIPNHTAVAYSADLSREIRSLLETIPPNLASIDIKQIESDRPTVFLIRDIHSHYEAQKKIVAILFELAKKTNLSVIATEGLEGTADFEIFRSLPYKDIKKKILDDNLRRGEVSAVEYVGILNPTPLQIEGVERTAVFYRHIIKCAGLLEIEQEAQKDLSSLRSNIEVAKQRFWPKTLIHADGLFRRILNDTNTDPDLFRQLLNVFSENGVLIESAKYPHLKELREIFAHAEFSHATTGFTPALSKVNTALFNEIASAGLALKRNLANSDKALHLIDLDEIISLLESTLERGVDPSQVERFRNDVERFDWSKEYQWLAGNKSSPPNLQFLREYTRRLKRFIETAEERDRFISENFLRLAGFLKPNESMALVIGGFHTKVIERLLRNQGINCVTITPMIDDSGDRRVYARQMMKSAQLLRHAQIQSVPNDSSVAFETLHSNVINARFVDAVRPIGIFLFSPALDSVESESVISNYQSRLRKLFFEPYSRLAASQSGFDTRKFTDEVFRESDGRVYAASTPNQNVMALSLGQFLHALKSKNEAGFVEGMKDLSVNLQFRSTEVAGFGADRNKPIDMSHAERMSEHPRLIDIVDRILRESGLTDGNGSRLILIKELIVVMAKIHPSRKAKSARISAVRRVIESHYGLTQVILHALPFKRMDYEIVEAYEQFITEDSMRRQVASQIAEASNEYLRQFNEIMRRAPLRFILSDITGIKQDEHARLNLYIKAVEDIGKRIEERLKSDANDEAVWIQIKEHFKDVIAASSHGDLGHAFFNAVKSRFVPLDELDFMEVSELANPTIEDERRNPPYFSFSRDKNEKLDRFLWRILTQLRDQNVMPEIEIEESVRLIARRLRHHFNRRLDGREIQQIEILKSGFFRHGSGYIVGRVKSGIADPEYVPLVLSLAHAKLGAGTARQIFVDKVFTRHSNISRLFSHTQSHFHVALDNHRGMAYFLKTIMPWKAYYALYRSTGYNNLAKATLLVDLFTRMADTKRNFDFINFEFQEGNRGHVMYVIDLPGTEAVIKIIRDDFTDERPETREDVKRKYEFVRYVNRRGVLLDVQNFRNIRLPKKRFAPELVKELERGAKLSVEVTDEHVILKQFYTMRRVIPLDFYTRQKLREMKNPDPIIAQNAREQLTQAMVQYGVATKTLAEGNIFSGDQLTFNFGLIAAGTPNQRIVLYDYDQIVKLTDLNFRLLPESRDEEEELMGWHIENMTVMPGDVFPEQLRTFGGIPSISLPAFLKEHGDLFWPAYYGTTQDMIRELRPELIQEYPYTLLGKPKGFGVSTRQQLPPPLLAAAQYFQEHFGVAASFDVSSESRNFIRDALVKWPWFRLRNYRDNLRDRIIRESQGSHWVLAGEKAKHLLEALETLGDHKLIETLRAQQPNILIVLSEGENVTHILPDALRKSTAPKNIWIVNQNVTAEKLKQQIRDRGFYGVPLRYLAEIDQLPPHFRQALSPKQLEQLDGNATNLLELISNYLLASEALRRAA